MNYLGLGTYKEKTVLAQSSGGWTSTKHSVGSGKDHGLLLIFRSCLLCSTWTNHCVELITACLPYGYHSSVFCPLETVSPPFQFLPLAWSIKFRLYWLAYTLYTAPTSLFVFWDFFICIRVSVCHVCVCAQGGHRRAWDLLRLEWTAEVVSHWCEYRELRAVCALNHRAFSKAPPSPTFLHC